MSLMFKISYGLYILSATDGDKDNACVINTLSQQTAAPERLSVTVNKANLTHDYIAKSGKCAVGVLATDATFDTIKNFGMQSGKTVNKFANIDTVRAENGVLVPVKGVLGYFELKVENSIDFGTHTMFVCSIAGLTDLRQAEPLTYSYYQSNIKP
ncbi:MAG: flavin reductase family protein, partial [Clostridia bacterium]